MVREYEKRQVYDAATSSVSRLSAGTRGSVWLSRTSNITACRTHLMEEYMKRLPRCLVVTLSLLVFVTTTPFAQRKLKEIRIVGYITEFHSSNSFEVEDYRISRDESVILEFENQHADIFFKQSDLRIGTLVEIRGLFDEASNELKATKIKLDLEQFRQLDVTTILDRKPLELSQTEMGWTGLIAADGRRIRISAETKMLFALNKTEKTKQKQDEKIAREKKKHEGDSHDHDWTKMNKGSGDDTWAEGATSKPEEEEFVPLESLADVGAGTVMTYHGREQPDGSVLATSVEFMRNEMEDGEFKLWKKIKVEEKSFNPESGKPSELKVGPNKYK